MPVRVSDICSQNHYRLKICKYARPFFCSNFGVIILGCALQGTPEKPARIVLVSSIVHYCCTKLDRDDMNQEKLFSPLRAYGISKYAQVGGEDQRRNKHRVVSALLAPDATTVLPNCMLQ